MKFTRKTLFTLAATTLLLLTLQAVLADERINQVHHFGGDTLYCTQADGCWLTNMQGEILWQVSQATIDEALAAACEAGVSGYIEAGMGTYGPSTIGVSCYLGYEPSLKLIGYDEWGKVNTMMFPTSYEPVYAPPMDLPEPTPTPIKTSG